MEDGRRAMGRKWREGKVRPIPGNPPHDRPVSRGIYFTFWRICDDPFDATSFPHLQRTILRRPVCVFKAWRNLSGPIWQSQNQTLGWDRAASRWSAPGPGSRTRREDHAPSHRPQMSSGRLFLDRVGRHQSPSPLRRHPQINTHSAKLREKGDISTLPTRGHFYFALTAGMPKWKFWIYPDKISRLAFTHGRIVSCTCWRADSGGAPGLTGSSCQRHGPARQSECDRHARRGSACVTNR
jgi:hypothetical protein